MISITDDRLVEEREQLGKKMWANSTFFSWSAVIFVVVMYIANILLASKAAANKN